MREDKWERKEYIATRDSDLIKDIIKRLHMWELKKNCPREEDMKCRIFNGKEDTTEHILKWQTAETIVVKVYRNIYKKVNS